MTLFLLVTSALALDNQSLRSTTTSDLFRDPYDFFDQPGLLSFEEERAVLTLLNGYGSSGRYMLGYYGGVGPGVFGAAVDYGASSSTSDSNNVFEVDDEDNDIQYEVVTDSRSSDKTKAWTAVLSYGFQASDTMGLGAELRIAQTGQSATYNLGAVGGSLDSVDYDDEDIGTDSTTTGNAKVVDRTISVVAGGAINGDSSTLSVHAVVNAVNVSAKGTSNYISGDYETNLTGYVPGTSFSANRKGVAPGLTFEGVFDLSDTMALRVDADVGYGFGGPAVMQTSMVEIYDDEDDFGYESTTTSTYGSDSKWTGTTFGALVAMQIEGESIKIRPGLRVRAAGYNEYYTLETVSEYNPDEGDSSDSSSESESKTGVSALTVGLPLAVEVSLDPDQIWTLRMGGDWAWTRATLTQGPLVDEDEDAGTKSTTDSSTSASSSNLTGAFGLRYWPIDAFRLDGSFFGGSAFSPADGESGATPLASVWLSATLVIP